MRFFHALYRLGTCVLACAPLAAQSTFRDYSSLNPFDVAVGSRNSASVGVRLGSRTNVRFSNLGSIESPHELEDITSRIGRTYDDGYVGVDTRTDSDGNRVPDDHRTNNWGYTRHDQVTPDQQGIAFHAYSSKTSGAEAEAKSGLNTGVDLELSRMVSRFGPRTEKLGRSFSWGVTGGFAFMEVNARTRGTILADLHVLRDVYSLLGAPPPVDEDRDDEFVYSAPSRKRITVTNPDGSTTEYEVDTTTFLGNRPELRTEEVVLNGASIDGVWQVKGAHLTLRAGPWLRWQPSPRFAFRLSAGGAVSWLGLDMRYAETLRLDEDRTIRTVRETSEAHSWGIGSIFAALDTEWWVTERTGFFASAVVERADRNVELSVSGRSAAVAFSDALGLRVGLTTRF